MNLAGKRKRVGEINTDTRVDESREVLVVGRTDEQPTPCSRDSAAHAVTEVRRAARHRQLLLEHVGAADPAINVDGTVLLIGTVPKRRFSRRTDEQPIPPGVGAYAVSITERNQCSIRIVTG